jgi:hypothetical protein
MRVLFLLLAAFAVAVYCADEMDRVVSLPGYGAIPDNEKQYAGYLLADKSIGSSLFYWFFECTSGAAADAPVLVWLNGGN